MKGVDDDFSVFMKLGMPVLGFVIEDGVLRIPQGSNMIKEQCSGPRYATPHGKICFVLLGLPLQPPLVNLKPRVDFSDLLTFPFPNLFGRLI